MKLAPVLIFTYNRPWHTMETIEALKKNELAKESELFIYSDEAKDKESIGRVREVREYIKKTDGFKKVTIIEREKNWGLADNIIDGVTKIVNEYGKIIVLEDDLVTSPYFLKFMNDGLEFYKNEERVVSIHGCIYPVKEKLPDTFFIKGADCWGWATWKRGWDLFENDGKKLLNELKQKKLIRKFNFNNSYPYLRMLQDQIEGKNNSWAIRWYASAFLKDKLTLYPGRSLVNNFGFDGSGIHCGSGKEYDSILSNVELVLEKIPIEENLTAKKIIGKFFLSNRVSMFKKVYNKLKFLAFKNKNI